MSHTPQSLADMLERDYFPPNSSLGKNLYLSWDEWRMVIDALRAPRAEVDATKPFGWFDTNEKKLYPTKAAAELMGCIETELLPLYMNKQP